MIFITNKIILRAYSILIGLLIVTSAMAQAPESMGYSVVIRDAKNELVSKKNVAMKVSILKSNTNGKAIFVETHTPTSNDYGLVNLEIGNGKVVSGSFADIKWGEDKYFIKTETDPAGGTDYSIKNTTQLHSVPYALYAKKSGNSEPNRCFTNRIGQEKDGGIIYYLYIGTDGKEHGLIVHKKESELMKWQNSESVTGAGSFIDGKANTIKMTNSPAKNYVDTLGDGWYIPSLEEIRLLGDKRFIINKVLSKLGADILANYWHLTSSEYNKSVCYVYNFDLGLGYHDLKTKIHIVRAVRAF